MRFPAHLVLPEERQCLQAVQERLEHYSPENRFKNWLECQDADDLKEIGKGERQSAQRFLYYHAAKISETIPEHLIAVVIAMIEQWGWDVDMEGHFGHSSRNSSTVSGDETFLEWLSVHRGEKTCLPEHLQWPITLDDFVRFDQEHRLPRNQEWLIALLVASGANPWTMKRADRRNLALNNCYYRGHPSIAVQLLNLPGAPSWREALDTPGCFDDDDEETTLSSNIFGEISTDSEKYYQSNFLPSFRAFSEYALTPKEMVYTTQEMMATNLYRHPPTQKDEANIEELLKDRDRGTRDRLQRLALLPKNSHWSEGEIRQQFADELFRKLFVATWAPSYDRFELPEQKGLGIEWLTTQRTTTGPFAGKWSLFNAYCLDHTRSAQSNNGSMGTCGFPLNCWLEQPGEFRSTKHEDFHPELAALLNEDLGNGLPVRGLWTLLFLGKDYREKEPRETTGLVNTTYLEKEGSALGIHDWQAFFEAGREDAVIATEWMIERSPQPQKARHTLACIWARCVDRFPSWMDQHPGLLARALRALSTGQALHWKTLEHWPGDQGNAWERLMFHAQKQKESAQDNDDQLFLESRLGTHHPWDLDAVSSFMEDQPTLNEETWARLNNWHETQGGIDPKAREHKHYRLEPAHLARFKAALIKSSLPEVQHPSVEKERF